MTLLFIAHYVVLAALAGTVTWLVWLDRKDEA